MDNENQTSTEAPVLDEKTVLKARAAALGLTVSNNISVETLRAKVEAAIAGEPETPEDNPLGKIAPDPAVETLQEMRTRVQAEGMKLVRCKIQCLDPKKKDLPGEIFCVANEYLGTVRKFIPFGEVTEDGYHVPQVLFDMLKERQFQNLRTVKDKRTGTERVEQSWVKEFALEVLPPLTPAELERLASAQKAAGSVDHTLG
jgi:hypothetical protein